MIWYVSYGSNMCAARLGAYLRGGRPVGSRRDHVGARDPSDPVDDAPCRLPYRRFFAGDSRSWGGGGVAYIDPEPGSGDAAARRYLVTTEQFFDIWAQESGRPIGSELGVDLAGCEDGATLVVGDGAYDRLVVVGTADSLPMVTFTTPHDVSSLQQNPPSIAYRDVVVAGLCESHDVDPAGARAVLAAEVGPIGS